MKHEIVKLEFENLRVRQETMKDLQEVHYNLESEINETEPRRQQKKLQLQDEEMSMRRQDRELEREKKKVEAASEQRLLKIEVTKGSSKASGPVADEIENIESGRS